MKQIDPTQIFEKIKNNRVFFLIQIFKTKIFKNESVEENLVFCFGALFNSTLNFTQSG